ncbi:MAG TPA: hypothetical protein VFE79_06390, partial [Paraburkholderia sp.]|nr:hypothetical protein [Paraburkholderia sp.]
MNAPYSEVVPAHREAPSGAFAANRSESWQAAWIRRALPLVVALQFGSSRRPAPDVVALRQRANR